MREFAVIDCVQRSEEWFRERLGRVTSSTAHKMLAKTKSGYSTSRQNLLMQLALEIITGRPQEASWESPAMVQGRGREADALAAYETLTGRLVQRCGFLKHDTLRCGASLDGYLGDFDIVVEAKSPIPATHWEYLSTGAVPLEYRTQALHQLFVTGARECHWLSYCPEFPAPGDVKLVVIPRLDAEMAAYELELRTFLGLVDKQTAEIRLLLAKMEAAA
jgi:hypothetical protein